MKLYLLEGPRSVSDMLRDLTEKELSSAASLRQEEIPRMAGNWFKEDTGYIWRLREADVINDVGRQYALNKEWLVEGLVAFLGLRERFPEYDVRGETAKVEASYSNFMHEYTLKELKQEVREQLFSGSLMADLFTWEDWRDVMCVADERRNRVQLYRPALPFWTVVHMGFISSILVSRNAQLTELMEQEDQYFRWKSRREQLEETTETLVTRSLHSMFPAAERDPDGTFIDDHIQRIAECMKSTGVVLPEKTLELLSDLYLLSFDDGVGLFEQQTRQDEDIHLLFNLLERGWVVESRNLERDPATGNYIVPLNEVRSYLDSIAHRFETTDAVS